MIKFGPLTAPEVEGAGGSAVIVTLPPGKPTEIPPLPEAAKKVTVADLAFTKFVPETETGLGPKKMVPGIPLAPVFCVLGVVFVVKPGFALAT